MGKSGIEALHALADAYGGFALNYRGTYGMIQTTHSYVIQFRA